MHQSAAGGDRPAARSRSSVEQIQHLLDVSRRSGPSSSLTRLSTCVRKRSNDLPADTRLAQLRPHVGEESAQIAGERLAAFLFQVEALVVVVVFQHQERGDPAADAELLTVGCHQCIEMAVVQGQAATPRRPPPRRAAPARCRCAPPAGTPARTSARELAFDNHRGPARAVEARGDDQFAAGIDRGATAGDEDVAGFRAAGEADTLHLQALAAMRAAPRRPARPRRSSGRRRRPGASAPRTAPGSPRPGPCGSSGSASAYGQRCSKRATSGATSGSPQVMWPSESRKTFSGRARGDVEARVRQLVQAQPRVGRAFQHHAVELASVPCRVRRRVVEASPSVRARRRRR